MSGAPVSIPERPLAYAKRRRAFLHPDAPELFHHLVIGLALLMKAS
jgi:hypothetical protein